MDTRVKKSQCKNWARFVCTRPLKHRGKHACLFLMRNGETVMVTWKGVRSKQLATAVQS
jgi:hypothetical protein